MLGEERRHARPRIGGRLGAVAKANFSGLRFREPVYRTPRELALSYFEDYFNDAGEKTLRAWSGLLDLRRFDPLRWMFDDAPLQFISDRLDALRHHPILTPALVRGLSRVDDRSRKAGRLGVDRAGLYRG